MENNPDGHLLMDLAFEIQKTNLGIRIRIPRIWSVPIFKQNRLVWTKVTFPKTYLELIFILIFYFSKFELVFAVPALFHEQVLFFVYGFCWNNENIIEDISHGWVQKV